MRVCKIEEPHLTLEEAFEQFINFKKAQQVAERTLKDYNYYLYHFLEQSHNTTDYPTLTNDVLTYFANIPVTSPARFNHPYSNLNAFFNWAIKQDILPKNPLVMQGIHKKRDDGNIKPVDIEDVKILLNSWDKTTFHGLRNYIIILTMLDTGIRTCELTRLKNSDFDPTAKQITINKTISKTRRHRTVYLSASTSAAISRFLKVKPDVWDDWLFPTREGNQMSTERLDIAFRKQCDKVGVKFTPYQLRHTFATYFVTNGGNIFMLQDLMGHSDIRMTRRYTEIDGEAKRQQHGEFTPINALQGKPRLVKLK